MLVARSLFLEFRKGTVIEVTIPNILLKESDNVTAFRVRSQNVTVKDPQYIDSVIQIKSMDIDYIMEYPLSFTGLYKTQIIVKIDGFKMTFYYTFVNMVIDLLAGFGMYANHAYEYFCKSENMFDFQFPFCNVQLFCVRLRCQPHHSHSGRQRRERRYAH